MGRVAHCESSWNLHSQHVTKPDLIRKEIRPTLPCPKCGQTSEVEFFTPQTGAHAGKERRMIRCPGASHRLKVQTCTVTIEDVADVRDQPTLAPIEAPKAPVHTDRRKITMPRITDHTRGRIEALRTRGVSAQQIARVAGIQSANFYNFIAGRRSVDMLVLNQALEQLEAQHQITPPKRPLTIELDPDQFEDGARPQTRPSCAGLPPEPPAPEPTSDEITDAIRDAIAEQEADAPIGTGEPQWPKSLLPEPLPAQPESLKTLGKALLDLVDPEPEREQLVRSLFAERGLTMGLDQLVEELLRWPASIRSEIFCLVEERESYTRRRESILRYLQTEGADRPEVPVC